MKSQFDQFAEHTQALTFLLHVTLVPKFSVPTHFRGHKLWVSQLFISYEDDKQLSFSSLTDNTAISVLSLFLALQFLPSHCLVCTQPIPLEIPAPHSPVYSSTSAHTPVPSPTTLFLQHIQSLLYFTWTGINVSQNYLKGIWISLWLPVPRLVTMAKDWYIR